MVKFRTEIIGKEVPQDPGIEELKYWCGEFHRSNLAPPHKGGTLGNLSFRSKDGEDAFIITGSRVGLSYELLNDAFVAVHSCDLTKGTVFASGTKEPSMESMLHFAIYNRRKDVNAVFHGHSEEILAHHDKLNIPETKQKAPHGSIELVQSVLEIVDDEFFLVMKDHGFISIGKTMKEAGELALEMYKKCLDESGDIHDK
jgi:ribulose-5-phosphate 4-epimerase/fuculose-1-phosphate aldolase